MDDPAIPPSEDLGAGATPRLLSASLYCENCGATTVHRILRVDRGGAGTARRIRGVARCRVCRFTHPFESRSEDRVELTLIVSAGPNSERRRHLLPRTRKIQVGTGVPGSDEPLLVSRIDGRDGRSVSHAFAGDVATVWATRDVGAVVRASIVDGRRTVPVRGVVPHGTILRVGEPLPWSEDPVEITGLRARRQTWRRRGDAFPADEVVRVYARRTAPGPGSLRPRTRVRPAPSARAPIDSDSEAEAPTPGPRASRRAPRS